MVFDVRFLRLLLQVFQHTTGKHTTLASGEIDSSVSQLWENPEKKVVFQQALQSYPYSITVCYDHC